MLKTSCQNVKTPVARTKLLVVIRAYLVGVKIIQKAVQTIDPSPSGIAYHYDDCLGKIRPCGVVQRVFKPLDDGVYYCCRFARGIWKDVPAWQLLTGWEYDFPDPSAIDWGEFKPIPSERDLLADGDPREWSPFEEKWEPSEEEIVDYYEDLAKEYGYA